MIADAEARFRKLYSTEKIAKLSLQIHQSVFSEMLTLILCVLWNRENGRFRFFITSAFFFIFTFFCFPEQRLPCDFLVFRIKLDIDRIHCSPRLDQRRNGSSFFQTLRVFQQIGGE